MSLDNLFTVAFYISAQKLHICLYEIFQDLTLLEINLNASVKLMNTNSVYTTQ